MQLGLEPLCPVAVVGFLTPECLFSYFGAIIAGWVSQPCIPYYMNAQLVDVLYNIVLL